MADMLPLFPSSTNATAPACITYLQQTTTQLDNTITSYSCGATPTTQIFLGKATNAPPGSTTTPDGSSSGAKKFPVWGYIVAAVGGVFVLIFTWKVVVTVLLRIRESSERRRVDRLQRENQVRLQQMAQEEEDAIRLRQMALKQLQYQQQPSPPMYSAHPPPDSSVLSMREDDDVAAQSYLSRPVRPSSSASQIRPSNRFGGSDLAASNVGSDDMSRIHVWRDGYLGAQQGRGGGQWH